MDPVGRNDPCPCGSGRKYKDCCSGRSEPVGAAGGDSAVRESALSKLLAFGFQPAFDSDHAVAEIVFWGNLVSEASPDQLQWLLDSEDANVKYNTWFLFDWDVDEGGSTVAELFLDEEGSALSRSEREFVERLSAAHLRLYEVERVEPGKGVRLLDLWTSERLFVTERGAPVPVLTWDLLGARVAPDGRGGHVFEGGLYLYPADAKEQVFGHLRRLFRRHHRKHPFDDPGSFFRRHGAVFHHLWLNLVAFPEPPLVVTPEGHPLMFCRSVFDAIHPERVRGAVASQPDIRAVDSGRFSWREQLADGERELGTWAFEGERLIFETNSQERAARGRVWLEGIAGEAVRFRATALETLEQTINQLRRSRAKKPLGAPPAAESGAVRDLFDRHYQSWLDRPEPALGNRTPRAAARSRIWRGRVVDLLKQMENGSERGALAGRPAYDFGWLWRQLGLERP